MAQIGTGIQSNNESDTISTMRREEDGTNYPNYLNGCKFQISQNYLLSQCTATDTKHRNIFLHYKNAQNGSGPSLT